MVVPVKPCPLFSTHGQWLRIPVVYLGIPFFHSPKVSMILRMDIEILIKFSRNKLITCPSRDSKVKLKGGWLLAGQVKLQFFHRWSIWWLRNCKPGSSNSKVRCGFSIHRKVKIRFVMCVSHSLDLRKKPMAKLLGNKRFRTRVPDPWFHGEGVLTVRLEWVDIKELVSLQD